MGNSLPAIALGLSAMVLFSPVPQDPAETPLFKLVIKKGSGDGQTQTMSANEATFRNYPIAHVLSSFLRMRPVLTEGMENIPDSKVDIDFVCYTMEADRSREMIANAVCRIYGIAISKEKRMIDTVVFESVTPTDKMVRETATESFVRSNLEKTEFKGAFLGSLFYSVESLVKMPVADETKDKNRYTFTWIRPKDQAPREILSQFAAEFGLKYRIEKRPHEVTIIKKA